MAGMVPALLLALCSAASASSAIPASVVNAAVSWPDANFAGELGSFPLGNGDVASNVWISNTTGDLNFYIAKSDAFDQNSQPVKVGKVALRFDPPLWTLGQQPQPQQPQQPPQASDKGSFEQTLDLATGTVTVSTAAGYAVSVWVDYNNPVVRVTAANTQGKKFKVTATLDVYRNRYERRCCV